MKAFFSYRSPYFHWVLSPSDSPCSNEFLLPLSYPILKSCIPSSLQMSDSRFKYLGRILSHTIRNISLCPTLYNHSILFLPPFVGVHSGAHRLEIALAETASRTKPSYLSSLSLSNSSNFPPLPPPITFTFSYQLQKIASNGFV